MLRFFVLCFLVFGCDASAATLARSTSGACTALLEGTISSGDYEAFVASAPSFFNGLNDDYGTGADTMCLNSPGGNLAVALKIAAFVEDNGIGTVIDDRGVCLSACAVIFMMGSVHYYEDGGLNRKMHVNGTLGFHRPAFSPPQGRQFTSENVSQSFSLAIEATLEFVKLSNRRTLLSPVPMIKSDLIEAMFDHRGQDFFFVDSVNHAGRWDIDIFGYVPPRSISVREAQNACNNLGSWGASLHDTGGYEAGPEGYLSSGLMRPDINDDRLIYLIRGDNDGLVEHSCLAYFQPGDRPHIQICGFNETNGLSIGSGCTRDQPDQLLYSDGGVISMFPSNTKLRDLPLRSRQTEAEASEINAGFMTRLQDTQHSFCTFTEGETMFINKVRNFVNLRQSVGLEASVVAEVPLHTRVKVVVAEAFLNGDAGQREICNALCKSRVGFVSKTEEQFRQEELELQQCFAQNVLWFQIQVPDGRKGFVSAKYLRFE